MTQPFRVLVDETMALFVVGAERLPVRTVEELERACAVAITRLALSEREAACRKLADAYTRHIELAAQRLPRQRIRALGRGVTPEDAHTRGYRDGFWCRPARPPSDPRLAAVYLAAYQIGAKRR